GTKIKANANPDDIGDLLLGRMKMILENKRSVLQKYNCSQKLSQIGKSRLFRGRFQHSNFRNSLS
ncbi:hypothetical protein, partial [Leptospira alexanderi]|uniref:hypothetical protein n=1 Tax=Leptospira alexanderi TaxID=100053 RepID=UPI0009914172